MTANVVLYASQRGAGLPIRVNARMNFDAAGWGDNDELGLGVTTSGTTPTNKSAFAYSLTYEDAAPIYTLDESRRFLDGTISRSSHRIGLSGSKAVDANFAAGRYVWAYAALTDGTFQDLSASYHIT